MELREQLIKESKEKITKAFSKDDVYLIKGINIIDEMVEIYNRMVEHCRDWYNYYFPEMNSYIKNNDLFCEIVEEICEKENYTKENLKKISQLEQRDIEILEKKAKESIGGNCEKEMLKQIQEFAKNALKIKKQKNELQEKIEKEIEKKLPNFTYLAKPNIATKMIQEAGSIERLVKMPSSTIQILGAEKALFSHLVKGTKPPKHGFLVNHPLVRESRNEKGKISRIVAGKLSLLVKEDYYKVKETNEKETKKENNIESAKKIEENIIKKINTMKKNNDKREKKETNKSIRFRR